MNPKIKDDATDLFCEAILSLKTVEECYSFLDDICTISEIKAIAQRMVVAKMLDEKCVYSRIIEKTGASTATISRVNRCLTYGSDGYRLVLDRLGSGETE